MAVAFVWWRIGVVVVVVEEEEAVDARDVVVDPVPPAVGRVLARGVVPAQGAAQSPDRSHAIVRAPSPSLSLRTRALGPDLDPSELRCDLNSPEMTGLTFDYLLFQQIPRLVQIEVTVSFAETRFPLALRLDEARFSFAVQVEGQVQVSVA